MFSIFFPKGQFLIFTVESERECDVGSLGETVFFMEKFFGRITALVSVQLLDCRAGHMSSIKCNLRHTEFSRPTNSPWDERAVVCHKEEAHLARTTSSLSAAI